MTTTTSCRICALRTLLCDVHAVRRRGKARLLGDRDEVPEMAQLNIHRCLSLTAGIQTAGIQTVRKA